VIDACLGEARQDFSEACCRFGDLVRSKSYSREVRLNTKREVKIVDTFQLAPQLAQN
jgi:hypothetical protein